MAVTGAAGAVGYAVQLAKADGCQVIADAAPKGERLVQDLGAEVVLPRGTEFPELVREEVPDGVDGLVDTEGVIARRCIHGAELVGELDQHEDNYRLCYVRGPEDIVVGLA
ncbi:hypothetical protein [Streptomyces sp. NBC_00005]|uniref:hypothetical protein n=1 Tax=Streptomyces sp. NBC_00005 TaxID=2903609 RepID=UPI00386F6B03